MDKDAQKLAAALAEIVAWYSNEDAGAFGARILKAEKLVKRLAIEELNKALAAVETHNAE